MEPKEKRKLPIYKLVISPTDESGVSFVSMVDEPAIERAWMAFESHKRTLFKTAVATKQMVSGPLMIADLPIFRTDPKIGDFYVMFDAQTIEQIALQRGHEIVLKIDENSADYDITLADVAYNI